MYFHFHFRYVLESTVTHTPITFKSIPDIEMDSHSASIHESLLNSSRRNTIATNGFESILSDIHDRCKITDDINQDLECKLQFKNKQLSENCALLEQSTETISMLQQQLDNERKETSDLKESIRDYIRKNEQVDCAREEAEAETMELRQEISQTQKYLAENTLVVNTLRKELEEMQTNTNTLQEKSEELKEENQRTISNLNLRLAEQCDYARQLQEAYGKEEKARKQAEREASNI